MSLNSGFQLCLTLYSRLKCRVLAVEFAKLQGGVIERTVNEFVTSWEGGDTLWESRSQVQRSKHSPIVPSMWQMRLATNHLNNLCRGYLLVATAGEFWRAF